MKPKDDIYTYVAKKLQIDRQVAKLAVIKINVGLPHDIPGISREAVMKAGIQYYQEGGE